MWERLEDLATVHVVPVGDLREHDLSGRCWCHPSLDGDEVKDIVIHNALDGREAYETGELRRH